MSRPDCDDLHTSPTDPEPDQLPIVGLVIWNGPYPNIFLDTDALGKLFDGRA